MSSQINSQSIQAVIDIRIYLVVTITSSASTSSSPPLWPSLFPFSCPHLPFLSRLFVLRSLVILFPLPLPARGAGWQALLLCSVELVHKVMVSLLDYLESMENINPRGLWSQPQNVEVVVHINLEEKAMLRRRQITKCGRTLSLNHKNLTNHFQRQGKDKG